jgi:phosphoribosylcarboxyaminoimidazole (NCAIR) mutase
MTDAKPLIGIIMGSRSDWETMRHAAETLDALGVPYETPRRAGSRRSSPAPAAPPICPAWPPR